MALVTGNPAVRPNATGASGLNRALSLIAAAPDPKACVAPPKGKDPFQVGVLKLVADVVGLDSAAVLSSDIALMARLDQARACLKRSAPPKGFELGPWLEGKSNASNRKAYDAKKKLILAAQDLAKRKDSLRFLEDQAEQFPDLKRERDAYLANAAIADHLSPFQRLYKGATEGLTRADERCKAARERVISLTRELTNELQSQRL